jgi:Zn finger protein HypA/HybF involved in hydrogenase expression
MLRFINKNKTEYTMTDQEFINICNESVSMAEAAVKAKMHFNTFKRRAVKLECYKPNQGGQGHRKPWMDQRAYVLEDILDGRHPQYSTYKLKHRLYSVGLKSNACEECGTSEWNGKSIECEMDHINGDRTDHRLENLRILCPNCHSQTDTFRAKNT